MTISIIGAWQVFANVGITFERINIFTCGKKHGNRRGVWALARAQIYIRKNFVILLQENDPIFFQNSFYSGSVYMRRVRQCTVDGRSAS